MNSDKLRQIMNILLHIFYIVLRLLVTLIWSQNWDESSIIIRKENTASLSLVYL